jgi:branched-chain amino acid transport system substrate-binding protein
MNRRDFNKAAAATAVGAAFSPLNVLAQARSLKVGVLLPRSGVQAGIGQDCHRVVGLAGGILKDLGLPALDIMNGDTESNVDVARSRAERLISEGAQLLVGAFDSGQTTAIAPSRKASRW